MRERLILTIPELRGDDAVVNLLAASVEANVATLLHVLEHGIVPESVGVPAAAVEYACRLAQGDGPLPRPAPRDVPLHALVRAYRAAARPVAADPDRGPRRPGPAPARRRRGGRRRRG